MQKRILRMMHLGNDIFAANLNGSFLPNFYKLMIYIKLALKDCSPIPSILLKRGRKRCGQPLFHLEGKATDI